MCDHPLCDVELAGEAVRPLCDVFHQFLQSVADVMMYVNPGSPLQVKLSSFQKDSFHKAFFLCCFTFFICRN